MDITIQNVEHKYHQHTPLERLALYDINLAINSGTFLAIIGHTGSGKSTLLQHLNGLLKPTVGSLTVGEMTIDSGKKNKKIKKLRQRVGIVFQFPEHQLFEETVEKDICFGPTNFGVSEKEAKKKALEALELVGLPSEFLQRSPFDLSGGQMRRVAIAGVLAMEPEVLVLDEPTAGLDPRGRTEIMDMFYKLHQKKKITTVLVTHSMEDAAKYADEIVVMDNGTIRMKGKPEEIFSKPKELVKLGLDVPEALKFKMKLESKFGIQLSSTCLTIDDALEQAQLIMGKVKQHDG
ncbi:energy-coupling factor ABC transporter ATP-binding protein [Cytobacillus sp. IB215665]|uniref:energy-coupling factor ABC transporter ATP-binding protein n=1 Tax=Cytobacillus sp. IB215665 TaxID=3097357 RepID=UPI002A0C534B|nr:energy-coupling factor ABC transporter ATP-binding protein [Cytobacillus sp. IB215665]MDX8367537.1 energy-coupling factor ABC transporter ATP-binding protein [Cytobacillus sp. IB215665]